MNCLAFHQVVIHFENIGFSHMSEVRLQNLINFWPVEDVRKIGNIQKIIIVWQKELFLSRVEMNPEQEHSSYKVAYTIYIMDRQRRVNTRVYNSDYLLCQPY